MDALHTLNTFNDWLPVIFMALMGIAMLAYVILDGYDLGVGMLMLRATAQERDVMIASIGPFWDANETWLVLGVGLLLVAFPQAHGVILTALYLPVAFMLAGLILRGVAFDFRVKARAAHQLAWNYAFIAGSALATFAQGYMLGMLVMGFGDQWYHMAFAAVIGLCLMAGYALLGAGWLIMKTQDALQRKAVKWGKHALVFTALGIGAVSIATPLLSPRIFDKWFTLSNLFMLAPIPIFTAALFGAVWYVLNTLPRPRDSGAWIPFAASVGIFLLAFHGLAYSLFPYLVPDRITIWQAASAPESLKIILVGALVVLPTIIGYTIYSYRVFWGKTTGELSYD